MALPPIPEAGSAAPSVMPTAPLFNPSRPSETLRAGTAGVRRGDLVAAGPGVTLPKLLHPLEPRYPLLATRLKLEGRVLIRALVDENGRVTRAEVVEGDPSKLGFDQAALEAAQKALYQPATKGGVPVKIWVELPVSFKLH